MAEQGPPQVLQGLYKTFEVIDLGNTGSTESRIVSLNLETSVLVHVQNKVFWPWTVFFSPPVKAEVFWRTVSTSAIAFSICSSRKPTSSGL